MTVEDLTDPLYASIIGGIMYKGITLQIINGVWVAIDRGTVIAQGSKSYVFSVIDGLQDN
jgi:hypothetical protein